MSRGLLTANFSLDDLPANDFRRKAFPRFAQEAIEQVRSMIQVVALQNATIAHCKLVAVCLWKRAWSLNP